MELCSGKGVLVVCLCGIPGAGKSTFTQQLAAESSSSVLVVFDSCASREEALEQVRRAAASGAAAVVVADDNNYYRSMRRQVYRAARDAGAAYVQVLLDPPLPVCLERNAARTGAACIPEEVVTRMHGRLERPDGRGWDVAVVGEAPLEQLRLRATHPVRPAESGGQAATVTAAERRDLEMRREISRRVAAVPLAERAALAAQLNKERKAKMKK